MTTCTANTGGLSSQSMSWPVDVWSDGEKLAVTDADNMRVLIWDSFPTENGQAADLVMGQADMNSAVESVSQDGFTWPSHLWSNGSQMFVVDCSAHRVLIWNEFPTTNQPLADVVVGQPDFNTSDSGTMAQTLYWPGGILIHENKMIINDQGNNRALIFEAQ